MKKIHIVIGIFLAAVLMGLTSCHTDGQDPAEVETSAPVSETHATVSVPATEWFAFDRVSFEGDCHDTAHLEEYLNTHWEALMTDMSKHGIVVDADTEIRPVPIHMINMLTGTVGLHAHFLPVLERGELVNAVSVNMSNEAMSVSASVSWPWMSEVNRVLTEHPQENYLLTTCLIEGANYICLISSQNEVCYIVRPSNGGDLPFEEGVNYFEKLYDDRLVISHVRLHGGK